MKIGRNNAPAKRINIDVRWRGTTETFQYWGRATCSAPSPEDPPCVIDGLPAGGLRGHGTERKLDLENRHMPAGATNRK